MNLEQMKDVVVDALEDVKAIDIRVIDVGHLTDVADALVIASGSSNRQVKALANSVREKCREHDEKPLGAEGEAQGEWVLLDYGQLVVHIMLPETREFYDLERLWQMAADKRIKD